MSKKLTIEFIRAEFEKEGYELLITVYEGNKQKLEYICPNKHRGTIKWNDWQQGHRCSRCGTYNAAKKSKKNFNIIMESFVSEGYILKTTESEYINAFQKLDYICPKGHEYSISWSCWQRGHRCLFCAGQEKLTIKGIKSEFEKEGYTLLTLIYRNNKQKLKYICSNGHKHNSTLSDWRSGYRCPYCSNNAKPTIEFIKSEFEKEGYILLSTGYKNNKTKLRYICSKGHRHSITWNDWSSGCRCPKCFNNISKWEKEVKNFITELNIDYIPNDRTQLINPETRCGLELDLWFSQLNKAIECNGTYWHSLEKAIKNDKIKQQLCKEQNIDLLTITDEEWNEDTGKCKEKLISFIETGVQYATG